MVCAGLHWLGLNMQVLKRHVPGVVVKSLYFGGCIIFQVSFITHKINSDQLIKSQSSFLFVIESSVTYPKPFCKEEQPEWWGQQGEEILGLFFSESETSQVTQTFSETLREPRDKDIGITLHFPPLC